MPSDGAAVAGLVLAAGAGSRYGGPKALVEYEGSRLVDRAAELLSGGGCAPVVVVSGAVPLTVPGAIVVHNPDWATGMGSSLRAGLRALSWSAAEAVVVALVDQPWVGVEAVTRLRSAWTASGGALSVAVATYGGARGNPVLLARHVWDEVAALAVGDVGARPFLRAHPGLVTPVDCTGTGTPTDVDTPADLPSE
ncbi:nucleotidyltransferase family protein [Jiangella rhizosphaerae]|uniref:Nucleotidyltransferase family protein n=1 Tax=Jiangella rhizosphaerae TaxID=2293569 RepID=A0A418KLP0_9ACTN|nr:nucleotidyltransferase family protein [Jiangella rhizosphaerae]RIQ18840.1 nucleotidyltransferase family protein [Jiangella rhizosphaerae]